MTISTSLDAQDAAFFAARGFGGRLGFGARPAVLVIDLCLAFTDPSMPLGSDLSRQIEASNALTRAARLAGVPVLYSGVRYEDEGLRDAGIWFRKMSGQVTLHADERGCLLDPRLNFEPGDVMLYKKYASCFFGSDLASRLVNLRVDTLVLAGTSTSGCVRATAVDACQFGFRPMVVAEAVSDRSAASHRQSLFDLDTKYADVVALEETLEYLQGIR